MSAKRTNVFERIFGVIRARAAGSLEDGQLLRRFIEQKDEAAFEAIVRRHGPMVLGVCRRTLANSQDADDAFQVTFLVLVRKAASIVPRDVVGNWLYGVAYNVARKARALRGKRQSREKQMEHMPETPAPAADDLHDLQTLFDRELSRLPRKYRVPLVLCGLEGRTNKEAAQELGWPEGTVSGRLTRARQLLAKRLARQGLPLSTAVTTVLVSEQAVLASVPPSLTASTVKLATLFATGTGVVGEAIPTGIAALTKAVLLSSSISKVMSTTAIVMLGCVLGGGGLFTYHSLTNRQAPLNEGGSLPANVETPILIASVPAETKFISWEEFDKLPGGITVVHEPKIALATLTGKSERRAKYTWWYKTTVSATDGDVTIVEYGGFTWQDGKWISGGTITRKPYGGDEFAEWYKCPKAVLKKGESYSDPTNWFSQAELRAEKMRWYFVGFDAKGKKVKGEALIEFKAEIDPKKPVDPE